jgi:phytoene dehydrogenase-like protein
MKIFNKMLDIIERDYVPKFREHIVFKMLGSPTTNLSYCWAPEGNSYGMNLTPKNMSIWKLGFTTSFNNFYFCNASSGSPGFARAFNNGAMLYENLTNDPVL